MRKAILILLLFIPVVLSATNYYVSPSGNDNNPGTITQPFATWQYAFDRLSAGDILYVRGGKYTVMGSSSNGVSISSKKGTSGNLITVSAYPNEIPVLDCTGLSSSSGDRTGLRISGCSYWKIQGLTIINVSEPTGGGSPGPGCQIFGSSYITLEQCNVHDCANGFTCFPPSDYIYYINCDSYQNADAINGGDLANGFWTRVRNGGHIFYDGCRAWNNSDDGWDAFAAIDGAAEGGGDGYISYNRCWAFNNGSWKGILGNGAGFKTGATDVAALSGVQRRLTNCLSFNNTGRNGKGMGFDESQDSYVAVAHEIYNCVAYNNGEVGFNWNFTGNKDIIRNNISYSNNGSNGDIYMNNSNNVVDHNSWQIATVTDGDFISLDASQAKASRQSDGSLPKMNFLQLVAGSDLIDIGAEVGLPYSGKSPDVGAFEIQNAGSAPAVPVFISATVENATPSLLNINFDLALNNLVVPATSSFNVLVNSVARVVNTLTISGSKVQLALASATKQGDIISVSYTKPPTNPLQASTGSAAENIITKSVTNNCTAGIPAITASIVENATPLLVEMTYSLTLADIVPAVAAFNVQVNSVTRAINSVAVSGNKVQLTLVSAVKKGDIISVSYTKPATNQLQTSTGGAAENIIARSVINNSVSTFAVYSSSVIENATPSLIELTFSSSLANIVPAASAFNVLVNSSVRVVNSVSISGNKVLLTLTNAIKAGDIVAISYTKPPVNPLQTPDEGQSISISGQLSVNKIITSNVTSDIKMTIYPNPVHQIINILFEYTNAFSLQDASRSTQVIRIFDLSGKLYVEKLLETGVANIQIPINLKPGLYVVFVISGGLQMSSQKMIVY